MIVEYILHLWCYDRACIGLQIVCEKNEKHFPRFQKNVLLKNTFIPWSFVQIVKALSSDSHLMECEELSDETKVAS